MTLSEPDSDEVSRIPIVSTDCGVDANKRRSHRRAIAKTKMRRPHYHSRDTLE
jgi:hypothetical protein